MTAVFRSSPSYARGGMGHAMREALMKARPYVEAAVNRLPPEDSVLAQGRSFGEIAVLAEIDAALAKPVQEAGEAAARIYRAALALCVEALDEDRPDKMVLVEGDRLKALNDAIDHLEDDGKAPVQEATRTVGDAEVLRLVEAARSVINVSGIPYALEQELDAALEPFGEAGDVHPLTLAEVAEQQFEEAIKASFRLGAQACREMMARFVDQGGYGDQNIVSSIRANWHPGWGDDPGRPDEIPRNAMGDTDERDARHERFAARAVEHAMKLLGDDDALSHTSSCGGI